MALFKGAYQTKYEIVAAGQTAQALGDTGKAGDVLERLIIVPDSLIIGSVSLLDGTQSTTTVWTTGTLTDLKPIQIEFMAKSTNGAWKITTGSNLHVFAIGQFS